MAAAGIDYAICGYGTIPTAATRDALSDNGNRSNPPKLIGGGGVDTTTSGYNSFIDRYNNCDGAYLYFYPDDPGWGVP